MSPDEKYTTLTSEKIPNVFASGISAGIENGKAIGKQEEHKRLWDGIQNKGGYANYYYAFCYNRMSDEEYNPLYPIKCSSGTTPSQSIFYSNTLITDTKVEVRVTDNASNCFYGMENCHTIHLFTCNASTTLTNAFKGMKNLVNIEIGGTIGKNVSFEDSDKLSDASIDSIIEHLSNATTTRTLTFHSTVYDKMVASGKDALVTAKNWSLVKG